MAKIQISIKDEMLKRADFFAQLNSISRSGLIALAINQYLSQFELISGLTEMSLAVKKIADNNEMDEESLSKLQDFERLAKLILSQK